MFIQSDKLSIALKALLCAVAIPIQKIKKSIAIAHNYHLIETILKINYL